MHLALVATSSLFLLSCVRDGGATADATPTPGDALAEIEIPVEPAALQAWLAAGEYRDLPAESARHPSTGPHGGGVRTFVTPSLAASLATPGGEHPRGAAAVKELYDGEELAGWAVSVKLGDASDGGDGWYWYEVFSTDPGAAPDYQGVGLPLCKNCHAAGDDFVLIPFPLQ